MTSKKRPYKPGDEIALDIYAQSRELQSAAYKVGKVQLMPGEVYLSGDCYRALMENAQFYETPGEGPSRVFGLLIYEVLVSGYYVKVAPRLVMRQDVELQNEKGSGHL